MQLASSICPRCRSAADVHVRLCALQAYSTALIGQNDSFEPTNELENKSSILTKPAYYERKTKPNNQTNRHLNPFDTKPKYFKYQSQNIKIGAPRTINSLTPDRWNI